VFQTTVVNLLSLILLFFLLSSLLLAGGSRGGKVGLNLGSVLSSSELLSGRGLSS